MKAMGEFLLTGLVGVLALGAAWQTWISAERIFEHQGWESVRGKVAGHGTPVEIPGPQKTRYRLPVTLEFRARNGESYLVERTIAAENAVPRYLLGAPITVFYKPDRPQETAHANPSSLGGSIASLCIGLFFLVPLGLGLLVHLGLFSKLLPGGAVENAISLALLGVAVAMFLVPAAANTVGRIQFLSSAVGGQISVLGVANESLPLRESASASFVRLLLKPDQGSPETLTERFDTDESSSPPYPVGATFRVLFNPDDPDDWIQDRWISRWLAPVVLVAFGLAALAGAWFLRTGPLVQGWQAEMASRPAWMPSEEELAKIAQSPRKTDALLPPADPARRFQAERLAEVLDLWQPLESTAREGSTAAPGTLMTLRSTDPIPENWPPRPGDGLVYYVYPVRADGSDREEHYWPIARVRVSPDGRLEVKPEATTLQSLDKVDTPVETPFPSATWLSGAWLRALEARHTLSVVPAFTHDWLKPYYRYQLRGSGPVLPDQLRRRHSAFLAWLNTPT